MASSKSSPPRCAMPDEVTTSLAVTLPKSSGSGSANPAESAGVVELTKTPPFGADRAGAVGLAFGVRFVAL